MSSSAAAPPPADANEGCVGPTSEQAGKANACAGCPNQKVCASGEAKQVDPALAVVKDKLAQVKHKLVVLSGKGGVGKTTFACQLAFSLAQQHGLQVGLLDVDICGPSVPRVMGLTGQEVHQSAAGWSPVYVDDNLGVMSIGFMLPNQDDAVIWRGPRKNGLIKQFLTDVDWGELDYLIIDTPPGTSDEHLSIVQYLKQGCGVDGAVVVTTPQEVAMMDVRKELNFCKKTGLRVVGVVENMSGLTVPLKALRFLGGPATASKGIANGQHENSSTAVMAAVAREDKTVAVLEALQQIDPTLLDCLVEAEVFPAFGSGPQGMAAAFDVPFLGKLPLDPDLLRACEEGVSLAEKAPQSPAVPALEKIVQGILDGTRTEVEKGEEVVGDGNGGEA
jgi:Mrp family chromosome partitioning ATPase